MVVTFSCSRGSGTIAAVPLAVIGVSAVVLAMDSSAGHCAGGDLSTQTLAVPWRAGYPKGLVAASTLNHTPGTRRKPRTGGTQG